MALETLLNIQTIGDFKVHRVSWKQPPDHFIEINDDDNAITFKIQNGPVKEQGLNGCQVDEIIATARAIIEGLDDKFPCRENKRAIDHLNDACACLNDRRKNREARGVEGQSKS